VAVAVVAVAVAVAERLAAAPEAAAQPARLSYGSLSP
jgi:hypothetical protein